MSYFGSNNFEQERSSNLYKTILDISKTDQSTKQDTTYNDNYVSENEKNKNVQDAYLQMVATYNKEKSKQ